MQVLELVANFSYDRAVHDHQDTRSCDHTLAFRKLPKLSRSNQNVGAEFAPLVQFCPIMIIASELRCISLDIEGLYLVN